MQSPGGPLHHVGALADDHPQLWSLLRETSRSFYLTLRVLPGSVRPQIGLAYLLARTTDTVADTELIPVEQRIATLAGLKRRILGESGLPLDLRPFAGVGHPSPGGASVAERALLTRFEEAVQVLGRFTSADQRLIRQVLDTITTGQELDLRRFSRASATELVALPTLADTEEYTHLVAGCVGDFWTRICSAHLFPGGAWDQESQLRDGVRFGRGLQWVNILRDLPRDLRTGRCYLPQDLLATAGLSPAALVDPASWGRVRGVYGDFLEIAERHLEAGWEYTRRIPSSGRRVRLACAIPILLGMRTLRLLREGNPLDPATRIKVGRGFVRSSLWRACLGSWDVMSWDRIQAWARTTSQA